MINRTAQYLFGTFVSGGFLLTAALLAGCAGSSETVREKSSQNWYDQGTRLAGEKKYDEALTAFREASRGYRAADLDADIQIALADTYFNKEEFPAAVEAYTEFLRLHPHNARADYAQFRVGLSWQKQLSLADRSQGPARKAAAAFEALLRGYPRSPLLDQAQAGLTTVRRRIADHELTVAGFYLRAKKFQAAAGRYELVLRDYADLGYAEEALYELGVCYNNLREQEKAARVFDQLRREYPQSRFVKEIDASKG